MTKKPFLNATLAATAMLMMGACATATPYQPSAGGINSYGYDDTRIEPGKYRVSFRGNANTDRATVENYILLRAAELTLADGLGHFVIIDEDEGSRSNFNTSGFNNGFGGFGGFGGGFGVGGFGGGFGGGGISSSRTRERRIFDVSVIIQGFRGEKPAENFEAFNAAAVVENLR